MKSSLKVHRCRFVEFVPSAINCLAFSPNAHLAVGRMDGSIEIWNSTDNWFCEKRMAGSKSTSVESLVWIQSSFEGKKVSRLFSAGLNSSIVEWNLNSLQPHDVTDSNGGAIWCMAANHQQTQLAVGCEDGIIRLFDIEEDGISYHSSLHKTDARILSIAWSKDDKFIYGGCSDSCIRQWNITTGRVQHRLAVDTIKGEDTLVWSIQLVADGMLVAGTSLGSIHFFSTQIGTIVQSFRKAHHADVLTLAVNQAGDTVYSSGVDRRILQFKLISTASPRRKWIPSGDRRWHSHDVRALALWDTKPVDTLISGGVDTIMILCSSLSFPNVAQRRISPFPPAIQVVPERRLVVAKFNHAVCVYKLGKDKEMDVEPSVFGQVLDIGEKHAQLLHLNLADEDNVTSCQMSQDGNWIAVSTVKSVKLFSVSYNDAVSVCKVKSFPGVEGAFSVAFTPEATRLITAGISGNVSVYDLANMTLLKRFSMDQAQYAVTHLAISSDGQWLAVGNSASFIEVYNLEGLIRHYTPPRLTSPFTSFSFHPSSPSTFVVTYTSNEFFLYDVEEKRMADWSQEYGNKLPKRFLYNSEKIQGVGYNPARPNMLTFWGTGFITFVHLSLSSSHHSNHLTLSKRKRDQLVHEYQQGEGDGEERNFIKIHDYGPLMGLEYTSGDELVVVERPWFDILPHLPPSFYRPTYGS
jgi:U3 small nucleolar RNA-associated protein 4